MYAFRETDTFFGAADTRVTGSYRPGTRADVPEQDSGTVGIGFGSFAAEFVQTPAFAMTFIAKLNSKSSGIEMRAAFTVLMNQTVIGKLGSIFFIELRQAIER